MLSLLPSIKPPGVGTYILCVVTNKYSNAQHSNAAVEAPVEDKIITPIANINLDQHSSMRPLNINVSCERAIAGELTKIKFDGKSCVRSFIQRITEFRKARDISSSKLLSYATEIFTGDALHWFRGLDGQDDSSDWDALLTRLKKDFDQTDYDYRLLSEIRARTQGENENITIYLSIMSGLFSRLSSELSNEDKLEILLHNIKPCYASTLASATTIPDIDTLRSLCRNYENIHARLANYKEPPRPSSETLAPEYAYNGHSSNRSHNSNQNYKPSSNVGNNYDRNRSYPNYRANVNKLNPNNYVHALHTSNAKPKFCPRCRDNTHHLRQCTADRSKIICFVCGEDQPTDDPRPYATIYVNHISMLGLLDTGAVVTIIGNNRHIDLEKQGFKLQQGQSLTVTAAGGQRMHSIGHMILPAKFEVQTFPNHLKSISFLKDVTSIASIDSAPSSCLQAYDHLSQSEKAIADNIIAQFNDISTENKGLGETKLNNALYRLTKNKHESGLLSEFSWKEVVPCELREQVINENHAEPTAGHLGIFKTYNRLALRYFWPGMHKDVVKFVSTCSKCLSYKAQNHQTLGEMGRPKQCSRPFQVISIDLMGPLPVTRKQNSYILVVTCCFSKFCLITPLRAATAVSVCKFLEDSVFLVHGIPKRFIWTMEASS
ncbi:retrotransposon gag protein domain-containing protein [Phthorimaea operculella]|nr:retrotransposon gag protein domain-containing protein [Phthorimaea operculella]